MFSVYSVVISGQDSRLLIYGSLWSGHSPGVSGKSPELSGDRIAALRAGAGELANLRRLVFAPGIKFPSSLLKHADDQTVAALAVVLKAMARRQRQADAYRDWGVVAAPTMFGRESTARA